MTFHSTMLPNGWRIAADQTKGDRPVRWAVFLMPWQEKRRLPIRRKPPFPMWALCRCVPADIELRVQHSKPRGLDPKLFLLRKRLGKLGLCRFALTEQVFDGLSDFLQTLGHLVQGIVYAGQIAPGVLAQLCPVYCGAFQNNLMLEAAEGEMRFE